MDWRRKCVVRIPEPLRKPHVDHVTDEEETTDLPDRRVRYPDRAQSPKLRCMPNTSRPVRETHAMFASLAMLPAHNASFSPESVSLQVPSWGGRTVPSRVPKSYSTTVPLKTVPCGRTVKDSLSADLFSLCHRAWQKVEVP